MKTLLTAVNPRYVGYPQAAEIIDYYNEDDIKKQTIPNSGDFKFRCP